MVGIEPLRLQDVALWRAAATGDPEAARELLDDHMPLVYGFVMARVAGDSVAAEDLVQETLEEALRTPDAYRGDAALSTWLCAIARRCVWRHMERERRQKLATIALAPAETEPEEAFVTREDVMRALASLSVLHRQVLVLKYVDDLTVDEIALHIARPRVQVQSLLQRARDAFREAHGISDG